MPDHGLQDLFTCPRQPGDLRLSSAACAQLFARGKRAESWDPVRRCQGCPIGAAHAGESVPEAPAPPRHACLRCGKTGLRLVRRGQLCVSCLNRELELRSGKFRRKRPPAGLTLYPAVMQLPDGDVVGFAVASRREAERCAVREGGVAVFASQDHPAWRAPCLSPQTSLLPGA